MDILPNVLVSGWGVGTWEEGKAGKVRGAGLIKIPKSTA